MTTAMAARQEIGGREQRVTVAGRLEFREAEGGSDTANLTGFASVTEQTYKMRDWLGEYDEVVRAGAFTKTAKESDVRLQLNHDGLPLARTKSGTLRLEEILKPEDDPQGRGQTGLWVDADLDPDSGLVRDIRSAMKRGDLDQMSFGFQVLRQQWSPDYTQRDILEVRVFDVSVVTFPASELTSASMRALDTLLDRLPDDDAREALTRLEQRFGVQRAAGVPWYAAEADALAFPPQ